MGLRSNPVLIFFTLIVIGPHFSMGAIENPSTKLLNESRGISGGIAGSGFSLMSVEMLNFDKVERVVFDIGDRNGQELKGPPGYFHVEYTAGQKMIVVDFAQTQMVKVTEEMIRAKLKNSKMVKSLQMLQDPLDGSLSLRLSLHDKSKFKVFQVPGTKTSSKMVLDLYRN